MSKVKGTILIGLTFLLLPACYFAAAPQGLDELWARSLRAAATGAKPYSTLLKNGTYQPETVYFRDTETGKLIMKMTNGYNCNFHTERIPVWNCDGTRIAFHTDRLGGYNWMMNSDGSGLKRIPGSSNYHCLPVWDKTNPDIMYSAWDDVVKINVSTGVETVVKTISSGSNPDGVGLWCVLSPNSYLIATKTRPSKASGSYIYTMKTDGSDYRAYLLDTMVPTPPHNVAYNGGLHSISFTNKSDDSFSFGFGLDFAVGEGIGYTCNINGTLITTLPTPVISFGHSANSADGKKTFGYASQGLCIRDNIANTYSVVWSSSHVNDGHSSWGNDLDQTWAYATPGPEGADPLINNRRMLMRFKTDGSNTKEVLCNTYTKTLWKSTGVSTTNFWEANDACTNYNNYARGTVNRDSTKVHFTSDMLAGFNMNDLYVLFVNDITETSGEVACSATGSGKQYTVTWAAVSDPNLHHYNIYYSNVSAGFTADQAHIIASMPKTATSYFDWEALSGAPVYYKVTAVSQTGSTTAIPGSVTSVTPLTVYPNPIKFNGANNAKFTNVPAASDVLVYNSSGEVVKTIRAGALENLGAGFATWNGKNENDEFAPRGVYYINSVNRKGRLAVTK
ncbi:MAG: hypothetical protein A2231_09735 [Candidatus Firestonebacteria bacterium RIFOXYA2_FULL_40_8]|nr:MAG: hypothetical protein A2231_09735 [Candidatus Firestonebacteria bacterium RIFOXYA2_FULL_40_8]